MRLNHILYKLSLPCCSIASLTYTQIFGGHSGEVPPVPIPNTEVKLSCGDGTARATVWESSTPPNSFRPTLSGLCLRGFFYALLSHTSRPRPGTYTKNPYLVPRTLHGQAVNGPARSHCEHGRYPPSDGARSGQICSESHFLRLPVIGPATYSCMVAEPLPGIFTRLEHRLVPDRSPAATGLNGRRCGRGARH